MQAAAKSIQRINFRSVEPLNHQKTVQYVNAFVRDMVQFLNRFAGLCEGKLGDVGSRLGRMETTMSILEAKLDSIPGLEQFDEPLDVPEDDVHDKARAKAKRADAPAAGPTPAAQAPAEQAAGSLAARPLARPAAVLFTHSVLRVCWCVLPLQHSRSPHQAQPALRQVLPPAADRCDRADPGRPDACRRPRSRLAAHTRRP